MERASHSQSPWTVDRAFYLELAQSQEASRSSVAALCFLVWDICLTTDLEVTHMWMTPWASPKLLYFITRYYSLLALIILHAHQMTCRQWIIFEGISALILELSVELMLILRLYAMYVGSKNTLRIMVVPFVAQTVVMITSLGISIPRIMTSFSCIEADIPTEFVVYCITSILYESFLFSLTIRRYIEAKRAGWDNVALLNVLFRDGAWAFAVIFAVMVTNTVLFALGPGTLAVIGFPWLLAVLGSAGPRLILNVRAESKRHVPPSSTEDMVFSQGFYDVLDVEEHDADDDICDGNEDDPHTLLTGQVTRHA